MVGARIQIEQNIPVLEKATPFPPDGVTLFCRIATPFWAKGVAILQIT